MEIHKLANKQTAIFIRKRGKRIFRFIGNLLMVGKDFLLGRLTKRMILSKTKRGGVHVIAGGPSFIKSQELIKKVPGDVMMINYIFTSYFAEKYPPQYWVSADPEYVENHKFLKELEKYAKTHNEFTVGFPSSWCLNRLNINVKQHRVYARGAGTVELDKLDLFCFRHNLLAPIFENSATFGLYYAIQMGYKKIYLHGCEMQIAFVHGIKVPYVHSYEIDDIVAKDIQFNVSSEEDNCTGDEPQVYKSLMSWTKAYYGLHQVATYAKSLGVQIYNMSEDSVVDEFEKWR